MEHARVAIIDDDEDKRIMAKRYLTSHGHSVVDEASSLDGAVDLVDRMLTGETEADVILLDGNLTPGVNTYDDARRIAPLIRRTGIGVKIIGFSGGNLLEEGIDVDADTLKRMDRVVEEIAAIQPPA